MQVKYKLDGMLTSTGMLNYNKAFKEQLYRVTGMAMRKVGKTTNEKIQKQAQQGLKIKRQAVLKSFKFKIYDKNRQNLPSLQYYSRIPWMGVHTQGMTIGQRKKLIIPFSHKRIGYKAFKEVLNKLRASRNIFFKKNGNITLVLAKNTAQDKTVLAPFRKATRAYNNKIVRKDEIVVVGIMVNNVRMSKKFDLEQTGINSIKDIQKEVTKIYKTSKVI